MPLITFKSRATAPLFLLLLFTALPLTLLPLRLVAAIAGLTTFTVTHPTIRHILFDPNGLLQQSRLVLYIREELRRLINDVSLSEEHIASGGFCFSSLRVEPTRCELLNAGRTRRNQHIPERALGVANVLADKRAQWKRCSSWVEEWCWQLEAQRARCMDEGKRWEHHSRRIKVCETLGTSAFVR